MLSGWPIGHERADGSGAAGAPQPRRLERAIRTRGFGARAVCPGALARRCPQSRRSGGPVLELASGRSGTALALAAHGRQVTAIDVSDVALLQLDSEAVRRGVADRLNLVQADLGCWEPGETRFALVLSRLFWDAAIFHRACEAVMPGGVLAWESLALSGAEAGTASAKRRVKPGEPACLLPADFTVVHEGQGNCDSAPSRIMIARRSPLPGA